MVMADASSGMHTISIRLLWPEDEWCRQFLCSHPFLSHPPFLAQLWQWNVTWDISTMLIPLVVTLHSWDIHWCNFILLWIHEVNIMITITINTISCDENMQLIAAEKCLVTTCHSVTIFHRWLLWRQWGIHHAPLFGVEALRNSRYSIEWPFARILSILSLRSSLTSERTPYPIFKLCRRLLLQIYMSGNLYDYITSMWIDLN